jgi:hypothetical protein
MHLQNRVTPFGEIIAISQRGLFTGNRGIIHDPTKTLLTKRWATKAWLVCDCEYEGRRGEALAGRSWTELLFFDEAIALAAGRRPCLLCRRKAAKRFRASGRRRRTKRFHLPLRWTLSCTLECIDRGRKRLHPVTGSLAAFPDGAIVAAGNEAFTLRGGRPDSR